MRNASYRIVTRRAEGGGGLARGVGAHEAYRGGGRGSARAGVVCASRNEARDSSKILALLVEEL